MGVGLKERERVRSDLTNLSQKVRVADFGQALDLLLAREIGKIVVFFRINPSNVAFNILGQRRVGQEFGPRRLAHAGNQTIFTESSVDVEHCSSELAIKFAIIRPVEALYGNA